jgi:hypothetical protein
MRAGGGCVTGERRPGRRTGGLSGPASGNHSQREANRRPLPTGWSERLAGPRIRKNPWADSGGVAASHAQLMREHRPGGRCDVGPWVTLVLLAEPGR